MTPIYLSRAQIREIDRRSIEEFHIPGIVLMENASRGVANVARDELRELTGRDVGDVVILCGGGNNGGDGLAAARHLHNGGWSVRIGLTANPDHYQGDALINWRIVQAMGLPTFPATPDALANIKASLILDAIFGTGLSKPPREPFGQIVSAIEASRIPVVAIDLPSGLDCDAGQPLGIAVKARGTVTFVALKRGFANPDAAIYTGKVTVADIGCPRDIISASG